MSKEKPDYSALQHEATKREIIAGLQRAIDRNYRKVLETAKADWERLFAGTKDPSDACVSVRINSTAEPSVKELPRAGYLPKPASPPRGKTRPRLA